MNEKYIASKGPTKHEKAEEKDEEESYEDDDEGSDNPKADVEKDHSFSYRAHEDYERIKALSERQVAELHKKPGSCQQYEKDGMICSTCKDPETGDTSEVNDHK